jgi:hypothetical protein
MPVFVFYSQGAGLASEILSARFFRGFPVVHFPAVPRIACIRVPATSDQSARSQSLLRPALEALRLPLKLAKNPSHPVNVEMRQQAP